MGSAQVDDKMIREALLRLLEDHCIEPHEDWVSVRIVHSSRGRSRMYVVVIGYPAAKAALWPELDRLIGGKEGADPFAGIWVLSEFQAQMLCERHPERN